MVKSSKVFNYLMNILPVTSFCLSDGIWYHISYFFLQFVLSYNLCGKLVIDVFPAGVVQVCVSLL